MTDIPQSIIEKYSDIEKYPTLVGIHKEFQPYRDEPVMRVISKVKQLVSELAAVFGYKAPSTLEELTGYTRHILHWNKP